MPKICRAIEKIVTKEITMRTSVVDTERALLGCVLVDNKVLSTCDFLEPGDFELSSHREIFYSMQRLYRDNKPIDYLTVEHELITRGAMSCTTVSYITALTDECSSTVMAEEYAKIVRNASTARNLRQGFSSAAASIETAPSFDDVVVVAQQQIDKASERISGAKINDYVEAFNLLEKVQCGDVAGFVPTGIVGLDRFAPGPDEFLIIGARPSTGKSAIAMYYGDQVSRQGKRVLYFSIEMGMDVCLWRRMSMETGIEFRKFRTKGGLQSEDWSKISGAVDCIKGRSLDIICGKSSLFEICAETKRQNTKKKVDMIIVDHLHLMKHPRADRRDLSIKESLDVLYRMGKNLGVCVVMLAQLNRGAEEGREREPQSKDIRDCGAAEENADVIWLLHRPDKRNEEPEKSMTVLCDKNRNGATGRVILDYDYECGRFQ